MYFSWNWTGPFTLNWRLVYICKSRSPWLVLRPKRWGARVCWKSTVITRRRRRTLSCRRGWLHGFRSRNRNELSGLVVCPGQTRALLWRVPPRFQGWVRAAASHDYPALTAGEPGLFWKTHLWRTEESQKVVEGPGYSEEFCWRWI